MAPSVAPAEARGHLIVSLAPGERFYIGANIEIQLVRLKGLRGGRQMAKLAVLAPKSIPVDRAAVHVERSKAGHVPNVAAVATGGCGDGDGELRADL